MAQVLVSESNLTDIADAIREKTGVTRLYTPSEMAPAILNISGGNTVAPTPKYWFGVGQINSLKTDANTLIVPFNTERTNTDQITINNGVITVGEKIKSIKVSFNVRYDWDTKMDLTCYQMLNAKNADQWATQSTHISKGVQSIPNYTSFIVDTSIYKTLYLKMWADQDTGENEVNAIAYMYVEALEDLEINNDEPVTLYENSSGSNGTITLNDNCNNYKSFKIIFGYDSIRKSVEFPLGHIGELFLSRTGYWNNVYGVKNDTANIYFADTSVIKSTVYGFFYKTDNTMSFYDNENNIYVYKIIGYR